VYGDAGTVDVGGDNSFSDGLSANIFFSDLCGFVNVSHACIVWNVPACCDLYTFAFSART
jgi:hypothetical protein